MPAVEEINGINLDNYFLYKRDFNCFVYIHKKYLNTHGLNKKQSELKAENRKRQRCQQTEKKDTLCKKKANGNGSVLEQTIRFAKNLIPLTIPPSRDESPVYYTIKTTKTSKKKIKKEPSLEENIIYDKGKLKTVTKTFKKKKSRDLRESLSIKDSVNQSSGSNTLDDMNTNQSLSCTLSEVSDKKYHKREVNRSMKRHDSKKFVISKSFEAIAAEKVSEDADIKIHLMNEHDRKMLIESIRKPVLTTIQDCLGKLNNNVAKTNIGDVEKNIISNANKLDIIIEKLARIEKKLQAEMEYKYQTTKQIKDKTSTFERLGEDVIEENDISCSEEESQYPTDIVTTNNVLEYVMKEKKRSKLECGETGILKTSASVGVKTDLPSRLPTRFCWTDTVMENIE